MHAEIELFGGPQDGRALTIPAGSAGEPLSPLPVPSPLYGPDAETAPEDAVAWYARDHCRSHGVWVYKYTNTHCVQPSEVW